MRYFSHWRRVWWGPHFAQGWNWLPAQATHTIFLTCLCVHRPVSSYARDRLLRFWGFPLYRPLDGKISLSNVLTAIENNFRCRHDELVFCNARAGCKLFQSRAMHAARAVGEGRISPNTGLSSYTSHTYYFLSRLWVHWSRHHGKGNAGWDLCYNQTILRKQYLMKETILFYLFLALCMEVINL